MKNNIVYFPGCEPEERCEVTFEPSESDVICIDNEAPFDVSLCVPAYDGSLTSKLKTIIMNMFIHLMFGVGEEDAAAADENYNKLLSSYESPDDMALDLCGVTAKELFESAGIAIK